MPLPVAAPGNYSLQPTPPRDRSTFVSAAQQGAHNKRVSIQHRLGSITQGNGAEVGFT